MGTDSVIYIRTDGNSNIATGHLVRCLCIAQALESLGKTVCFLVSDKNSSNLLQDLATSIFQGYSFSFEVKILETAVYDNLESELTEIKTFLSINSISAANFDNVPDSRPTVFIDSYYVTPDYLKSLHKFAKIAYMDDLRVFNYNVDLVINYDVIPPSRETEYQQAYTNAEITLLGAGYAPLRRQFQNQSVTLGKNIKNILITTGGSDPYHFTETVVSYLLSQEFSTNFHVVVGKLFHDTKTLSAFASQNPSVHLHYNVSDMAALMKQCDYAISAAGTTLYELCALGIPAISFTMADNQIIMAETFAETGAVPYAGDIRNITRRISHASNTANDFDMTSPMEDNKYNPETFLSANIKQCKTSTILDYIGEHLVSMMLNYPKRKVQHHRMRSLVDGNGAVKIAEALCNL